MIMMVFASKSKGNPFRTSTDRPQGKKSMDYGPVSAVRYDHANFLGHHFIRLQGSSRYLRTFDGHRRLLRENDRNFGPGIA